MDLKVIMLSESQSQNVTQCMVPFTWYSFFFFTLIIFFVVDFVIH